MELKEINKKYIIDTCIFGLLFIAVSLVLFWKCRYGYAHLDEAFYPTIAYRFIQGDAILYDEWNNTQLASLLLVPFLKVYIALKGNLDGIYLTIRYGYTVLKMLIALLIYNKLKHFNRRGSMISSLMFLCFAGYGLMVLSYNSIASGGLLCSLLFLINKESDSSIKKTINYILSGVSLSVAVLAIPYLAVLYILYVIAVIVITFLNRKKKSDGMIYTMYSLDTLLKVSYGVAICIVLFLVYVFTHSQLKGIVETLPYILLGDPAHPVKSLYSISLGYFVRILISNHRNFYVFSIYALMAAVFTINIFDKKRNERRKVYILLCAVLSILLLVIYLFTDNYINCIVWVPNVLSFLLVFIERRREYYDLFTCFWIPGIVYTYLEYIASNTGFTGISSASCVAAVVSTLIIMMVAANIIKESKISAMFLQVFLLVTLTTLIYYRITYIFWEDGGLNSQTRVISYGPDKGLIVSEESLEYYNDIYEDTEIIRSMPEETNVLYLADQSLWLAGKQRCASYSPLYYSITRPDLLYSYYNEHPEKTAGVIYVHETYGKDTVNQFASRLNMKVSNAEHGWILMKEK